MNPKGNLLGQIPTVQVKKVSKPTVDKHVDLVLPGGDDLTSRLWVAMRSHVRSLAKWGTTRDFDTPAFLHARKLLLDFCDMIEGEVNTEIFTTAWSITEEEERI